MMDLTSNGWIVKSNLVTVDLYPQSVDMGVRFRVAYLIGRLKPQIQMIKPVAEVILQRQQIPWRVEAIRHRKSIDESHKSKIPQDGQEPSGVVRLADR